MPYERTLGIIKPDAVAGGDIGAIINFIEQNRRLTVEQIKVVRFERTTAEQFYAEHRGKSFYDELIDFTCSGNCVLLVIYGWGATKILREMTGPTDPKKQLNAEESIRGIYGRGMPDNAFHSSATILDAQRELSLLRL